MKTQTLLVLSCLLATQCVDSKPQWQQWPQLYQPYHYTQYALPIYSQNYLKEAAVTGHFPGTNQKVTPYTAVKDTLPARYFQAFCEEKTRKFGGLFDAFDENGDGQVTYSEATKASLETNAAPMTTLEKAWDNDDDLSADIKKKIKAIILPKFKPADANHDQSLDMNEFAHYATVLYDAIGFYEIALRDRQTASPTFDDEKIAQNEWDCTQKQIKDAKCIPHVYDQTKIEDMVGNNGDKMLDFAEYKDVMQFYKNIARQQGTWPQYC